MGWNAAFRSSTQHVHTFARHDGIVLDDIRDMQFLSDHQDVLQCKYDTRVESASTPGGMCAYNKYLHDT